MAATGDGVSQEWFDLEPYLAFGNKLKAARLRRGLRTVYEGADWFGVDQGTYSRWEKAGIEPPPKGNFPNEAMIDQVAEFMGISATDVKAMRAGIGRADLKPSETKRLIDQLRSDLDRQKPRSARSPLTLPKPLGGARRQRSEVQPAVEPDDCLVEFDDGPVDQVVLVHDVRHADPQIDEPPAHLIIHSRSFPWLHKSDESKPCVVETQRGPAVMVRGGVLFTSRQPSGAPDVAG
jgi:transcriptional regulator with XRE-family HTH domain